MKARSSALIVSSVSSVSLVSLVPMVLVGLAMPAACTTVVGGMPDWEALRDTGSAIKTDVMARLPELLEQLEANVTARGGVVHWAVDAAEANRIVTDLVRATGASEVLKVKSMATQDIGLNIGGQTCAVSNGTGSGVTANITNVYVLCSNRR